MTYRIQDWDSLYENNRTRDLKSMRWLPLPMSLDGDGYTLLMERKDGAAIYGAFIACLILAGKCEPRGTLVRHGSYPHDAVSISRITRISVDIIQKMLDFCTNTLHWLEFTQDANIPQEGAGIPHTAPQEGAGKSQEGAGIPQEGAAYRKTIQDITEQNKTAPQEGAKIPQAYIECAEHLKKRILENKQQKITDVTIQDWANDVRLMVDRDNRTVEQINALIDECHDMLPSPTGFTWRKYVLSMETLRVRWNEGKIYLGMNQENQLQSDRRQVVTPAALAAQQQRFLERTND